MQSFGQRGTVIQEFYRGANILITGGTGFMGKVLVKKLLRSCPHLSNIYLLVRSKKGMDPETRLDDIFSDPVRRVFLCLRHFAVFLNPCKQEHGAETYSSCNKGISICDYSDLLIHICVFPFLFSVHIFSLISISLLCRN
jgi:hypothetical protein